jgi:hypothetical protein
MARRQLPTAQEAAEILKRRRTRPAIRPAPPVGRSLTPLIKALDERFGKGPDALKARWKEIVGDVLAKRSEPMKIVKARTGGATLELKVDGPAATLVQHQAPDILARLDLILGTGAVTKLRIVQGPVRPPALRPGARDGSPQPGRRRKIQPLDAAAEAELSQGLEAQPDGPLKEALKRLGRGVLRQGR